MKPWPSFHFDGMLKGNDVTSEIPQHRRSRSATFLLVTAALIGLIAWWTTREWLTTDQLARAATQALSQRDFLTAEKYTTRLLAADPASIEALTLNARLAQQQQRWQKAIEWLDKIPDERRTIAVSARCDAGNLALFQLRRMAAAEKEFRRALDQDANCHDAHAQMAYLLGLQSRNWEALPHRLASVRSGTSTATILYLISLGDRAMDDPQMISQYLLNANPDSGAILGWARVLAERGQTDEAAQLFKSLLGSAEHAAEALSRWGMFGLSVNTIEDWRTWDVAARLTPEHPGIWYVRGMRLQEERDSRPAARCFWEVVRRDPEHGSAHYRLGRLLLKLGRQIEAQPFLDRADSLEHYAKAAELAFRVGSELDLRNARKMAVVCGLTTEAWGWSQLIGQLNPNDRDAVKETLELARHLSSDVARRSEPSQNPAARLDLSDWSWDENPHSGPEKDQKQMPAQATGQVRFRNSASAAGLDFQYSNGGDPALGLVHMFEVTGGGAAVLDFDRDDWPDVYLPQGGTWSSGHERTETDCLFRNSGTGQFDDVTTMAGLSEKEFSLGASIGDYDADGFPDVYVTNCGQDSLLQNNGDGTFSDATSASGIQESDYGASSVIADFSGDGLPDIYVVNYLAADDLWDRVCGGADGIPRSCLPQSFSAATSRFLLNCGDGSFRDLTRESGISELKGKGLGVIAANFDGNSRLGLFVANDVGPNFLLANVTGPENSSIRFQEIGLIAGVALNREGRSESAMGATAGDIDGDGTLDLFVTNFENETNTLYLQKDRQLFEDATASSVLAESCLPLVGWGTQFLDADLDGWLDVAVTNGHINNLTDRGKQYQMPPLFYRNTGSGQMKLLNGSELGDYFSRNYLGRAMARVDWNRDGREDLVVTHLDAPAALLTNESPAGHWVGVFLSGVRCERDAIGATVILTTQTRRLVRQMTAGDGNQTTNQRRLVFGLGQETQVQDVMVQWPGGTTEQFGPLLIDRDYRLIENDSRAHCLSLAP